MRLYLTALVIMLALPATAAARHQEEMPAALPVAAEYWQARGFDSCANATVGFAWQPNVNSLLAWVATTCSKNSEPVIHVNDRVHYRTAALLCGYTIHEYGHLAGLDHDDAATYPVMSHYLQQEQVPEECEAERETEQQPPPVVLGVSSCHVERKRFQRLQHRFKVRQRRRHARQNLVRCMKIKERSTHEH